MVDNIRWHEGEVSRVDRERTRGHRGATLWLTGLSGSGKSTIAHRIEKLLHERGCVTYVLDGDNIRHGLNSDLSFAAEDRQENIRRIGEVAKLFTDAGVLVLTAFISPYRGDRQAVRERLETGDFIEIHVSAPLEVCEQRDPKGLYARARAGEISDFTGIDAPYEEPENPEILVDSAAQDITACAEQVVEYLVRHRYVT